MTSFWNYISQLWKVCSGSSVYFNGHNLQNSYWFYLFLSHIVRNKHCKKLLWSHSGRDFLCYSSAEPLKTVQYENSHTCQMCDNSSCWQWFPWKKKKKKKSTTNMRVDKQSYFHFYSRRNRVAHWLSDLSMVTFGGNWTQCRNRFPVPSLSPACPNHSKALTPSQLQRFTSKQGYFM